MKKLFVIGDSISCYYGRHLEKMLRGLMEYDRKGRTNILKDLDDCTDGVNGGDSSMVLCYLLEVVKKDWFNPDILLFNCGLHDTKLHLDSESLQIPLREYATNLRQVISISREKNITPAWCRTTPLNPKSVKPAEAKIWHRESDIDQYNRAADEIMAENAIPIIDLFTFTKNLGDEIYLNGVDHVHFTEEAAALQAAFIGGALSRILKTESAESKLILEQGERHDT